MNKIVSHSAPCVLIHFHFFIYFALDSFNHAFTSTRILLFLQIITIISIISCSSFTRSFFSFSQLSLPTYLLDFVRCDFFFVCLEPAMIMKIQGRRWKVSDIDDVRLSSLYSQVFIIKIIITRDEQAKELAESATLLSIA